MVVDSWHLIKRTILMSAIGPKRTFLVAPHMSAFGGKADMGYCGSPLSRSLLGVKRTWPIAMQMSAHEPKRTLGLTKIMRRFASRLPVVK